MEKISISVDRSRARDNLDLSFHSSHSSLPSLNNDEFYELCRSSIKVSEKNHSLQLKLRSHLDNSTVSLNSSQIIDSTMKNRINKRRLTRGNDYQSIDFNSIQDPLSIIFFFILNKKYYHVLIPDHEISICRDLFLTNNSHESFFGLARLSAHQCKFDQSLDQLEKAINSSGDLVYLAWQAAVSIISNNFSCRAEEGNLTFLTKFFCCGISKQKNPAIQLICSLPDSIDKWWLMIELSLKNIKDIEPAKFYSSKIREIDRYFGYLSWSYILFKQNESSAAVDICRELIKVNGHRFESYILLWNYMYYTLRDYEHAEDIVSEALLKVQSPDLHNYFILFCVFLSKSQYKQKRINECLNFLLSKYIENPTYTVLLFYYGKFATKSEDFCFNGAAIGSLTECIKLCDSSRYGFIYFWLSKAYMQGRQYKEAHTVIDLGLKFIDHLQIGKISQLNKWKSAINENIDKLFAVENLINSRKFNKNSFNTCKELLYEIKQLHRYDVDILKAEMYWRLGKKERALKKLFAVTGISTVKMTAYFLLIKYLKREKNLKCLKDIAAEMIEKCKHCQVPGFVWVKANLVYAKVLAMNSKPGKAMLILKCIAKALPPLPFMNIGYTKLLQRAQSIQDLAEAPSKVLESVNAYSFSNYKNSFVGNIHCIRDFPNKIVSEEGRVPSYHPKAKMHRTTTDIGNSRKFQKTQTLEFKNTEEIKEKTLLGMPIPNLLEFRGFSICTDATFLYQLSKISNKFMINLQDGRCAICDFIELLKLEKDVNFREKLRLKALKLKESIFSKS